MKKNIFIICIILVLNLTVGCKQGNLNNFIPVSDNMIEGTIASSKSDNTKLDSVNPKNNSKVELKDKIFEQIKDDLNIKIRYPQISENGNIMIKKINKLIKEAAINKYYEHWNTEGLTVDQTYNVEKNENDFLSIVFITYAYVAKTAHPNFICHAVTVNLKTGEQCKLSDFVESFEYLEDKITDGKYEILTGGLKMFASDSDAILGYVRSDIKRVPMEQNTKKFYITDEGEICIIIDMLHAAGDYSIVCITNYSEKEQEIQDAVKAKNIESQEMVL